MPQKFGAIWDAHTVHIAEITYVTSLGKLIRITHLVF